MTLTAASPWRTMGDLTLPQFRALIPAGSPMKAEADLIYVAAKGSTALYAAHAGHESEWGLTGIAAANPAWHNALGNTVPGSDHQYMQFTSWAEGAAWWKQHVLDPKGPYAKTTTIAQYVHVYAPASDGNDETRYVQVICDIGNKVSNTPGVPSMSDPITFGHVPHPGFVDRQFVTANKPEGVGWDNVRLWGQSKKTPMFLVIHRMLGTLTGTDQYFAQANVGALTTYGIGTANIDGAQLDGYIYKWDDPYGYRVPWASGPVSAPYGDAVPWLDWQGNVWDYSICNACGVSLENSGFYDDTMTDFAFGELAKLVAYWFDQFGIAWDKAPIHPVTGISAILFHQEFTIGTGKICPGKWLMDRINNLISAASAIMKPYQTSGAPAPAPAPQPTPAPQPQYAKPIYIPALHQYGKEQRDSAPAEVDLKGGDGKITEVTLVFDTYRAIRTTPRLQLASKSAKRRGPDMQPGDEAFVIGRFKAGDGNTYLYSDYGTRFIAADFERIKD